MVNNHQEGNKVGGVCGDGSSIKILFENNVFRLSWKILRKSKPYLTFLTLVKWGVPDISKTLFPYSSIELINNFHGDFIEDKDFQSTASVPPTLKAWHIKEKPNVPNARPR